MSGVVQSRTGASSWNTELEGAELRRQCRLDTASLTLGERVIQRLGLADDGLDRIVRVARTSPTSTSPRTSDKYMSPRRASTSGLRIDCPREATDDMRADDRQTPSLLGWASA